MRSFEVAAGLAVLAVMFARETGPALRSWRGPAMACLVVFAGYQFTAFRWGSAVGLRFPDLGTALWVIVSLLILHLVVVFFLVRRIRKQAPHCLFDLAVCGALWFWVAAALGTNLLLRLAAGEGGVLDPPLPILALLSTFVLILYGGVRVLYRGTGPENLSLAALALLMMLKGVI
jgi:hypothetical protein